MWRPLHKATHGQHVSRARIARKTAAEDETARRAELAAVMAAKAATDKARQLDVEAASLVARLDKAPPVAETRAGNLFASVFNLSPITAASYQQQVFEALIEAIIAAALCLPELMLPRRQPAKRKEPERPNAVVETQRVDAPQEPSTLAADLSIARFVLACLPRSKGSTATWVDIFTRYASWCAEQGIAALSVDAFGEQFAAACQRLGIPVRKRGQQVWCVDVRLVTTGAKAARQTSRPGRWPTQRSNAHDLVVQGL